MIYLRLILGNVFRARLRSLLTITGVVIAILAFGLLQTVVNAWYAGSDSASPTRLITRNSISLTFSMPIYYRERLKSVPGVESIAASNWFGGIYREARNFFPQFAVEAQSYFSLYPEFVFKPEEYADFLRDRRGAAVGRDLANLYGFKVGDVVPIRGTIYPGTWEFVVRAIYEPATDTAITRQFYFHFEYLNETLKRLNPKRVDQAGVFVVGIADGTQAPEISRRIDAEFKNSLAETLTETEKAFTLGFVAMVETIIIAIRSVSYIVILIIMAVAANTMAMTARERMPEYATLKALGFKPLAVGTVIMGEALLLTAIGTGIGIGLTTPVAAAFHSMTLAVFAKFPVVPETFVMQAICAVSVGLVAGFFPAIRAMRQPIVQGLRHIG